MSLLTALQSLVFAALLCVSGFCLTYGNPEKISQLNSSGVESEFLRSLESPANRHGEHAALKALIESNSLAIHTITVDHRFIQSIGEMSLLLSLFQLAAVVLTVRIKRRMVGAAQS